MMFPNICFSKCTLQKYINSSPDVTGKSMLLATTEMHFMQLLCCKFLSPFDHVSFLHMCDACQYSDATIRLTSISNVF